MGIPRAGSPPGLRLRQGLASSRPMRRDGERRLGVARPGIVSTAPGDRRRAVSSWPGEPPFLAGTCRSPAFGRKSLPVLQRREDSVAWTRADCVARQAHRPCGTPVWEATVPGVGSGFPHSNAPRSPPKAPPTLGPHPGGTARAVPSSHARPTPAALATARTLRARKVGHNALLWPTSGRNVSPIRLREWWLPGSRSQGPQRTRDEPGGGRERSVAAVRPTNPARKDRCAIRPKTTTPTGDSGGRLSRKVVRATGLEPVTSTV